MAGVVASMSGTAASIARIVQEPASVAERAAQILEVLVRVLPSEAASISVRDPERQARTALAARGEVAALHAYCESPQGDAELDLIGLNRSTPPLRHTDLPMPAAGFAGSRGRAVHTRRAARRAPDRAHRVRRPTNARRPRPGRRRHPADGAGSRPDAHDPRRLRDRAGRHRRGRAHPWRQRAPAARLANPPGVLTAGSTAVAEAHDRLDTGDAYAVFLHLAAPGNVNGAGGLLRVSVLNCPGEGADHLRAAVLVSPAPDLRGLSRRDLEVLGFLVEDWPDERMAAALAITVADVAECIHRGMVLLAAPSRTRVAIRALPEGLFLPRRTTGSVGGLP
jgi:hypothetical protein